MATIKVFVDHEELYPFYILSAAYSGSYIDMDEDLYHRYNKAVSAFLNVRAEVKRAYNAAHVVE
jgi:hypothetical protein